MALFDQYIKSFLRNTQAHQAERARCLACRMAEEVKRRREAAQRGAQTRRQRRAQQQSEAQPQPAASRRTQAPTTRHLRQREHPEMLTVAIRGPLAAKMRELAERHGMSLSKLLQDALLVLEAQAAEGYEPGTRLASWTPNAAG